MPLFRLSFLALTLVSASGLAQRTLPGFELEHLTFNPSATSGLVLGTGDLMAERQVRASLLVDYQHNPLVLLEDGGRVGAVVQSRLTAHVLAAYGITRWLEVGLQVPVVLYQKGDTLTDVAPVSAAGLGTPWLQARVGLLSQERGQPLDLGIQLGLSFPWGSSKALTRDGTANFNPRVGVGRAFGLLRAGLEVGALLRKGSVLSPDAPAIADEVGSLMQLGANLTTTNDGIRGELDVIGWLPFTRTSGSLEVLVGGRAPVGPLDLFVMGGPGFGRMPGTPAFRVFAGLSFVYPRTHCAEGQPYEPKNCPELDIDHDGIRNGDDQCVTEAGVEALKGCPVRDTDNDGVTDDHDDCPTVPGLTSLAGCPDRDHDGVADAKDRCVDEAGAVDNQGCPWGDADHDGVNDHDDACGSVVGPKENKGCPWPDTDGDGTLDKDDVCPNEVGPADRRGCPVKDSDGDTVPDDLDNCPKEKGEPANQGCPKAQKQLVVITREKLVIKEKVFFDTGKATIKEKSFELLTQVARVLAEHPEIQHVVIEGHTDNVGKPDANRVLSQRRAESVRDFLTAKGVAASRLEPKGFGPDRPADVNTTAAGRENNRRVEFVVTTGEKEKVEGVAP